MARKPRSKIVEGCREAVRFVQCSRDHVEYWATEKTGKYTFTTTCSKCGMVWTTEDRDDWHKLIKVVRPK